MNGSEKKDIAKQVLGRKILSLIGLILVILISLIFFMIHITEDEPEGRRMEEAVMEQPVPTVSQEVVWVTSWEQDRITYFKSGISFSMETPIPCQEGSVSDKFAVLSYEDRQLTDIKILNEPKRGRILSYSDNSIKIWEENRESEYILAKDCLILSEGQDMDISLIGSRKADIYMDGDGVAGILVLKQEETMVRVIIQAGKYDGLYHDRVTITCDEDFTMQCGKREKKYKAGKNVRILLKNSLFQQGDIEFTSKNGKGFYIKSIERGESLIYPGKIELSKRDEGILVINELPIEDYLCRVVNSEMPESFGKEALCAQAVCARSYIAKMLIYSEYHRLGADVDDSTSCQVYNNQPMNETATEAVKSTKGQVLWKDGQIETAFYFSTSCGHTSSAGQVWSREENPSEGIWQMTILDKKSENSEEAKEVMGSILKKSLEGEDEMRAFLLGETPFSNELMLEKDDPWYRWSIKADKKEWGLSIEKQLVAQTKPNGVIFIKNEDGTWRNGSIDGFGQLKDVKVLNRRKSGVVTEIELTGTKSTVKIQGEYWIRKILSPEDLTLVRQDEQEIDGLLLLPSAYFSFENAGRAWVLNGGGYGHGVGLSQYGARDLAMLGCSYLQILGYYYPDCQLMEEFE